MNPTRQPLAHHSAFRPQAPLWAAAAMLACLAFVSAPVGAGDHPPFAARGGIEIADAAARAWAQDAALVYLENDEALAENGTAPRWGYLFFSPSLNKSRIYSIRSGKILVAEDLEMKFEAPPLTQDWIDSGRALLAAEEKFGREFCRDHEGKLSTMLLMRGAFEEKDVDETSWTLIYTSPHAPSLFVVVDATEGKVRRTWRG